MKIVSYNVNGIRAAIKKGFVEWVAENDFDIICIQETKAQPEQVDLTALHELGYHDYWHSAEKKGYSGLLILSKTEPKQVISGCGIEKYDREGRVLRVDFDEFTLINSYFPSGTSGEERQAYKMDYLVDIFNWINELKKEQPKLILVGDYNIAHEEIDIHNPKGNKKNSGFLPEEREWMTQWFESGFTDSFRYLNPEEVQYSWWTYRANARNNNKGWRIDYQSVTDNLKANVKDCYQLTEVKHSDHCPVYLEIDI